MNFYFASAPFGISSVERAGVFVILLLRCRGGAFPILR